MDYRAMAERALEQRSEIFERRKALNADPSVGTDAKRSAFAEMDRQMDALATEARSYVEEGHRQAEILGMPQNGLTRAVNGEGVSTEGEWRGMLPSRAEYRDQTTLSDAAGGVTVPTGVAERFIDMLRNKAVFLKGIPAENLIRFGTQNWNMPVLSDSDMPALVAENAAITGGDDDWDSLEFKSHSYKDIRKATHEVLADSALSMRNAIAQNLTRNVAAQYDKDAFQGLGPADGSTPSPILGLVGQGVSTEVGSASGDMPTWDDLGAAVGRIWSGNGSPSVIWAAPDAAIALGNEREGTDGAYLVSDDSPLALARRLPTFQSTSLPAGTAIVADGARIYAGVREDVRVAVSEHADFENDRVVFRLTYRVAGIYVVETASVQVLTKNDGV